MESVYKSRSTAHAKPKDFRLENYADKIFHMFHGEEVICTLEDRNEFMKYFIDRFGIDVNIKPVPGSDPDNSEEKFIAKVSVELSPTFYVWVFQFGGGIRIVMQKR